MREHVKQFDFDEALPGREHGSGWFSSTDDGVRRTCLCGWTSGPCATLPDADRQLRAHFGRTPQGRRLLDTLRHVGHSGPGA